MAEAEKVYTIPLRRTFIKTERLNRSKIAVKTIRAYFLKHTKAEDVKISKGLNELVWSRGAEKPPGKIKVEASLKDKIVFVKLPGEKEEVKEGAKPKTVMDKIKKRVTAKTAPPEKKERSMETKHEALSEVKAGE